MWNQLQHDAKYSGIARGDHMSCTWWNPAEEESVVQWPQVMIQFLLIYWVLYSNTAVHMFDLAKTISYDCCRHNSVKHLQLCKLCDVIWDMTYCKTNTVYRMICQSIWKNWCLCDKCYMVVIKSQLVGPLWSQGQRSSCLTVFGCEIGVVLL